MIGYCGINCLECNAYKATVTGNRDLLVEVSKKFWDGRYQPEEWACLGCGPDSKPFMSAYCDGCEIRACAAGKQLPNCAACPDFEDCRRLHDFIKGESESLSRTMGWLRQRYLADEKAKAVK